MNRILRLPKTYNLAVLRIARRHMERKSMDKKWAPLQIFLLTVVTQKTWRRTGDGGVILCQSKEFAEKIKSLRQYGMERSKESHQGFNSRLDELQGRSYRSSYNTLNDNAKRRAIAFQYNAAFKELPLTLPSLSETELHAMHLYVIECDQRNELMDYLRSNQIGASLHYPLAVHQHAAYANRIRGGNNLPFTDHFYQRNLTLPMYPELSNDALKHILSTVQNWFKENN